MIKTFKCFLLCAVLALTGCESKPPFELLDVTGADFGRDFALTDHRGQPRTLADFRGKAVILFFGFTNCPDMCPSKLTELAQLARDLGPDAERVQVLFATLDPERDTQEVLAKFVPSFNPAFIGLYGDAAATARVAKEFNIIYEKQPLSGNNYTIDHSTGTFVFDPKGRLRVFGNYGYPKPALLHDLRLLLQGA
jgi:protein SCO1/2